MQTAAHVLLDGKLHIGYNTHMTAREQKIFAYAVHYRLQFLEEVGEANYFSSVPVIHQVAKEMDVPLDDKGSNMISSLLQLIRQGVSI